MHNIDFNDYTGRRRVQRYTVVYMGELLIPITFKLSPIDKVLIAPSF